MFFCVFMLGMLSGVLLASIVPDADDTNEALFSIHNTTGDDLNLTVFVLNGGEWDEIPVSITNNTTTPLVITWPGEGGVNVHIIYRDYEQNERVLRYFVEAGENRIVILV